MIETKDYRSTVFLPKTSFPMKGNLPKREPEILAYWTEIGLYRQLREQSKGREKFILHWGPPYANGHIHMGHALTETLKDVVNKTQQMSGFDAPLVPGWDCHGLPIEWKIEESYRKKGKSKDDIDPLAFRAECRAFAAKWIPVQSEDFQRLGIIGDWENPYSTMDFTSEARIVEELCKFVMDGSLYRGNKPVLWSVVEKTALAEAEVEYHDHTSDSIYVRFPVQKTQTPKLEGAALVIWTTTPWTIPGNRAIAYSDTITYSLIQLNPSAHRVLIATDLLADYIATTQSSDYTVITELTGTQLKGTICAHPLHGSGYDFEVPALPADHVTTEAGTGLVHTAPGHGIEDFALGKTYDISPPQTVAGNGVYYDHVPLFAGQHIYKANASVIQALQDQGMLLHQDKVRHSYPHSWRSKAPLIYRTTAQWFLSMETNGLRDKALKAIDTVQWIPGQSKNRIRSMIQDRPDWCLSRQRSWGTPITVFIHKETGLPLQDDAVNQRIIAAVREKGADVWFQEDTLSFLEPDHNPEDFEKATDVLDVWFDSACTHQFVVADRPELKWPADLYLEGSDQHRGWFQSSLLHACGTVGTAPYRQVLTHGFILEEKGHSKMSKSAGNTIAPDQIIQKLGADILRLWVVSSNYYEDMRIGPAIIKQQEDIYRRLRNTLRYLLGAVAEFSAEEKVGYEARPPLEKWILHQLAELDQMHKKCMKTHDFLTFYHALHNFCAMDLSAFYFDIRKDRLYCDASDQGERRAIRTTMDCILTHIMHWLAPVLSFTAEEAYQARHKGNLSQGRNNTAGSIHTQTFPEVPKTYLNSELAATWEIIRDVRRVMTGALEIERASKTIGSSLQAVVTLYIPESIAECLKSIDLAELAITSSAQLTIGPPPKDAFTLEDVQNVGAVVTLAKGQKCLRCWKVVPDCHFETQLCPRCDTVVKHLEHA